MVSEWNKAGKTKWVQLETRQLRKTGESSFILFFTAPASGDLVFKLLCMWGAAHITALVTCIRQRTRKCVFCFQWRKLYRNIFQFHLFCLYFDIKDKLELESYLIWSHATIFLIVSLEIFFMLSHGTFEISATNRTWYSVTVFTSHFLLHFFPITHS